MAQRAVSLHIVQRQPSGRCPVRDIEKQDIILSRRDGRDDLRVARLVNQIAF